MKKTKKLLLLQQDLRNGMSIQDALTKHGLTFQEAVEQMPRPKIHDNNTIGEMYITKNRYGYHVRKRVNGVTRHFGVYDNLHDAIKVRDYCIRNGWHWRQLKHIKKECGVYKK